MRRLVSETVYGVAAMAWALAMPAFASEEEPDAGIEVIAVVGAAGEEEYGERFAAVESGWRALCEKAGAEYAAIGLEDSGGGVSDLERLGEELERRAQGKNGELWIVLIGHGTFDGRKAKFNLKGPDLSAAQLRDWLKECNRDLVVINTAASSGPFLGSLSGPGRVVLTATKSGNEVFFPEFGEQFVKALGSREADLDEDGQVSLLESFLTAGRAVATGYEERGLLATEHALIDDNGDGKGTRADWFQGVKVFKRSEGETEPDGMRAHQRHLIPSDVERRMPVELRRQRDEIELEVNALRYKKGELPEKEYYEGLEALFLQIAELYRKVDGMGGGKGK